MARDGLPPGSEHWDPDPEEAPDADDRGPEDDSDESGSTSELDIEKKWLRWTRVDPEQFRLFFEKYHDVILRYMLFRVDDYETAGELTGAVFNQAWEQLPRFRWQSYTFGAWLFHIARQVVGRHWRTFRPEPEARFEHERTASLTPAQPDEVTQERLDHALLRTAIRQLVPDRQEVFILHYWMGMTTREVALVTKKGEPLVKAHLRRGRRQLRRWLTENGMEYGMSKESLDAIKREEVHDSGWDIVLQERNDASDEESRRPGHDEGGDGDVKSDE